MALKWIGWIAAILEDLGLVKPIGDTNFFELSNIGRQVISKIVQNYKGELLDKDIFINDYEEDDGAENSQKKDRKYIPPNKTERKGLTV